MHQGLTVAPWLVFRFLMRRLWVFGRVGSAWAQALFERWIQAVCYLWVFDSFGAINEFQGFWRQYQFNQATNYKIGPSFRQQNLHCRRIRCLVCQVPRQHLDFPNSWWKTVAYQHHRSDRFRYQWSSLLDGYHQAEYDQKASQWVKYKIRWLTKTYSLEWTIRYFSDFMRNRSLLHGVYSWPTSLKFIEEAFTFIPSSFWATNQLPKLASEEQDSVTSTFVFS